VSTHLAHQQALCDAAGSPDLLADFQQRAASASQSGDVAGKYSEALALNLDLVNLIRSLTKDTIDRLGGIEAVKAIIGGIYDSYIAPLDIPGIPNLVEPAFDKVLRSVLMKLVDAVYAMGS